jgi:membrane-bound ClpP family serine protease
MDYLSWLLIIIIGLLCLYGCYIIVQLSFDAHKKDIVAGKEALLGEEGTVISVHHDKIIVRVLGELWSAESTHRLHANQAIKVIKLKGLLLTIEPIHHS